MNPSEIIFKSRNKPNEFSIEKVESSFPVTSLSETLTKIWDDLKAQSSAKGLSLWDGTYYRLESLPELQEGDKNLKLSTIPYSTVRSLIEYKKSNPLQRLQFSLHVNTGAIIKTSDGQFIFGKKKWDTHEAIDLVGGGLQSNELQVRTGEDLGHNILKEMHEEINVSAQNVAQIESIGFILAETMSIVMIFEILLNISFQRVQALFDLRKELELSELVGIDESCLRTFLLEQNNYIRNISELLS